MSHFIHSLHGDAGRMGEQKANQTNGGITMPYKIFTIFSLFIISTAVLMIPLEAQSNPANLEEVAQMKAGH